MSKRPHDWKGLIQEAGFEAQQREGSQRVLEELWRSLATMGRKEPPPGYEEDLLVALRAKLPLSSKQPLHAPKAAPRAPKRSRWSIFVASPGLAWGFSACLVVVGTVAWLNVRTTSNPATVASSGDMLVEAAQSGGDESSVQRWLASVGDSGYRIAQSDLNTQIRGRDSKKLDEALEEVARSVGMKNGI